MQSVDVNKEYRDIIAYIDRNEERLKKKLSECKEGTSQFLAAKEEFEEFKQNAKYLRLYCKNKMTM